VFADPWTTCPLSEYDSGSQEIISIVEACEPFGTGGGRFSPNEYMSFTQFYCNVRSIVMNEKGKIEEFKTKRDKKK